MITPLLIATTFVLVGAFLLYSARKGLATGAAETDEDGTLYREKQPLRFFWFVATQVLFGGLFLLGGLLLAFAAVFLLKP